MWVGSKDGLAPNLRGSSPYPCPGDKWEEGSSLVEQTETVNQPHVHNSASPHKSNPKPDLGPSSSEPSLNNLGAGRGGHP